MDVSRANSSEIYISLIAVTLFILALLIKAIFLPLPETTGLWDEYSVYSFVPSENGAAELTDQEYSRIREVFVSNGYEKIISKRDEDVVVFGYGGEKRIPLERLDSYYEARDPLYDPYLSGLPSYFSGEVRGKKAELLFLPRKEKSFFDELRLRGDLDSLGIPYVVSDGLPRVRLFFLILFIVMLGYLTLLLGKRERALFLLGALPLIFSIISPSFLFFTSTIFLLFGWALLLHIGRSSLWEYIDLGSERSRATIRTSVFFYLGFLLLSFIFLLLGEENNLAFAQRILDTAAHISILAAYFFFRVAAHRNREHRLFYPEFIRTPAHPVVPRFAKGMLLLFAVSIPFPYLYDTLSDSGEITMPLPVSPQSIYREEAEIEDYSWSSLERMHEMQLKNKAPETMLPDISDYIAHRAYIETYFYGWEYGFPERNEEVKITEYRREGISVIPEEKVVKMFTDRWYEDIIVEASKNGLTRLLLSQETPACVEKKRGRSLTVPLPVKSGYIGVFLFLSLVFLYVQGGKRQQYAVSREIGVMRKGRKVA